MSDIAKYVRCARGIHQNDAAVPRADTHTHIDGGQARHGESPSKVGELEETVATMPARGWRHLTAIWPWPWPWPRPWP